MDKFNIGDMVYLKHDTEQKQYMIIEKLISYAGVLYTIRQGGNTYEAYSIELTHEQNTSMLFR